MRDLERSGWAFLLALLIIGLLAFSFTMPWFLYTHSSGPKAPPGGPQGNDTGEVKQRLGFAPFQYEGNATPDDPAQARQRVDVLGYLVAGGIGAAGLVLLLEIPVPYPFATRPWTLGIAVLGFLACAAALAWAWFAVPSAMADHGVTGAFTSSTRTDGYLITRLDWGWVAGGIAAALWIPLAALRYQTGAYDPSIVEGFAAKPRRPD